MDVLIRLLICVVVLVVSIIAKRFFGYRCSGYGDPIVGLVICSFLIILLLWLWRNNKVEFIKRCILAAPFAPLLTIVFKLVGFETVLSIYAGILIFLFLLMRVDNWKQHFFITLMMAIVFTFLLTYTRHKDLHGGLHGYKFYVIFGLGLFFFIFYITYLGLHKTMGLRLVAVKSVKLAGAIFLLFVVFMASLELCEHYQIGFAVSFMISVLISLGFLWACYRFKIGRFDNSSSNKKNETISEAFTDKPKMK